MLSLNRKLIEDYFNDQWKEMFSQDAFNILIDLTCQAFSLNNPKVPDFIRINEPLRPHKLGQI